MKQKLIAVCLSLLLFVSYHSSSAQAWGEIPPASVSANVVRINADRIYPFYRGFARIEKGNKSAVIDRTGKIVLPFGDYQFLDVNYYQSSPHAVQQYDRFVFRDAKSQDFAFITLSGKVQRLPSVKGLQTRFDEKGRCIGVTEKGYVLVDTNGKVTPIATFGNYGGEPLLKDVDLDLPQPGASHMKNGLSAPNPGGYGYKSYLTDKYKIAPQFQKARPFSEGLAAVMKLDEFGKERWGFIDTSGKVVIPLQYSLEPGDFAGRLALVKPADKTEFFAAFIDKSGKERVRLKTADYAFNSEIVPVPSPFMGSGWAYFPGKNYKDEDNILGTDGSVRPLSAFLYQMGGPEVPKKTRLKVVRAERNRLFIQADGDSRATLEYDLLEQRMRFIPCPVNQMVVEGFNYDEQSRLRHFKITDRKTGKETEGYLNDENEFVIIKDNKQTW